MADQKISELSSVSQPLLGPEILPVVESGETKKTLVSAIRGRAVAAYRRGTWYQPLGPRQGNDGGFVNQGTQLHCIMFPVLDRIRVQSVGEIQTNAGSAAGQLFRMAIYATGPNGYPVGSPIWDSGEAAIPATIGVTITFTGLDFTLEPGVYYVMWHINNSVVRFRRGDASLWAYWRMLSGQSNVSAGSWGLRRAATFGDAPPVFTDSASEWIDDLGSAAPPFFALRVF